MLIFGPCFWVSQRYCTRCRPSLLPDALRECTPKEKKSKEASFPDLFSLLFWISLLFSFSKEFLPFCAFFPFFPKDFRRLARIKNPCFFGGFLAVFQKRKEKKIRIGTSPKGTFVCNVIAAKCFPGCAEDRTRPQGSLSCDTPCHPLGCDRANLGGLSAIPCDT